MKQILVVVVIALLALSAVFVISRSTTSNVPMLPEDAPTDVASE